MKIDNYLPLGSVVLLHEGKKRLMIYGRKQLNPSDNKIYDYIGCLYPEGNIESNTAFLFNNENIRQVFFLGLQDKEEADFGESFLKK